MTVKTEMRFWYDKKYDNLPCRCYKITADNGEKSADNSHIAF